MNGKPSGKVTYRQQYTRCGKERCRKCREGAGHGPYWYAYWSEKGRTISRYIGVTLPPDIAQEMSRQGHSAPEHRVSPPAEETQTIQPLLRVYLLGQYRIERKQGEIWETVENRTWHRKRARSLLGCLLSSPGRRMSREQLRDQLWPDLDADIAANRLNGAVHELRQILEPNIARPAASRLLRLERDVLELADRTQIWVDAEAFEQLVKMANAATDPKEALHLLERASHLYAGNYLLEELYSEWAAPRRDALQRTWTGMLLQLAQLYVELGEHINAIETLDRLRIAEPTNETALQRLMLLLTHLDRRGEALQVYNHHATLLAREYESEPLPETTELYEALRQGHIPSLPAIKTAQPALANAFTAPQLTPRSSLTEEQEEVIPLAAPLHAAITTSTLHFSRPAFHLSRHSRSPLIGRDSQLKIMRRVMEQIFDGEEAQPAFATPAQGPFSYTHLARNQTHALMLQGEAGIGKTRLAEELSLEAYSRGWAVAWSRSFEQEINIPYRPWTELIRTLLQNIPELASIYGETPYHIEETERQSSIKLSFRLEQLGTLLPELAQISPIPSSMRTPSAISLEQDRLHLWESTLHLLDTLSQVTPLLLVLDDLHWADDSSLDLLTYLIHHFRRQRILVIATCRDGELPPQHKIRLMSADLLREQTLLNIPIAPLSLDQIGSLVSHLPQDMVQNIQEQAAGNPFFAEELARFMAVPEGKNASNRRQDLILGTTSRQREQRHRIADEQALPEAISAVLERRLHRMSAPCRSLLNKAAVLGGSFELSQLLPMASEQSEDTILDLLDEALQAGLLTEEGTGAHITYHFWHPLIVSHLYDHLTAARKAQFHRRAAEALKSANNSAPQGKLAATILYHLTRGGGDATQIGHYAELAGHHAYALAAYPEAQNFYLQALHAIVYLNIQPPDTEELANQLRQFATRTIEKSLDDPLRVCRLLERIAECNLVTGHYEIARTSYHSILTIRMGRDFMRHAYPEDMTASDQEYQEAQIRALLWRMIGYTWSSIGNYQLAHECFMRGRAVMQQAGIVSGMAWASFQSQYGALLRLMGHFEEAQRILQEVLDILSDSISPIGDPQGTGYWLPGIYPRPQADAPAMPQALRPQTRIERALSGDPVELGYAHERLGTIEISMGNTHESLRHLHQSLEIFEQAGLVSHMTVVCNNIGAVHMLRRDQKEASHYLQRAIELAERIGDLPTVTLGLGNLGEMVHRSGDLPKAEQLLSRCLATCEQTRNDETLCWFSLEMVGIQLDKGDLERAYTYLTRALRVNHAIKSRRNVRYAQLKIGELRLLQAGMLYHNVTQEQLHAPQQQRLLHRAYHTLKRALTSPEQDIELEMALDGRYFLAMLHFLRGETDAATQQAEQILADSHDKQIQTAAGRTYCLLGQIMSTQGKHEQADGYFKQAIQLCQEHHLQLDSARALANYGLALLQRSAQTECDSSRDAMWQQGIDALQQARDLFAYSHAERDLSAMERLLASKKKEQFPTH